MEGRWVEGFFEGRWGLFFVGWGIEEVEVDGDVFGWGWEVSKELRLFIFFFRGSIGIRVFMGVFLGVKIGWIDLIGGFCCGFWFWIFEGDVGGFVRDFSFSLLVSFVDWRFNFLGFLGGSRGFLGILSLVSILFFKLRSGFLIFLFRGEIGKWVCFEDVGVFGEGVEGSGFLGLELFFVFVFRWILDVLVGVVIDFKEFVVKEEIGKLCNRKYLNGSMEALKISSYNW